MKPARLEQAPESARPALVRPGENPALDAALARLRQKEAAGPPADGAVAPAGPGAGPRRTLAPGWLLVGLSALAIAGTVIVMALAVLGSRRQAPSAAASGRTAPSAAPAPRAPAAPASAVAPSVAPAASSSAPAPAASLVTPVRSMPPPSASPPAPAQPAPAQPPTTTVMPVDPALIE
jgi:hypothetical protein